ncbi:SPOR domain-containing protein [Halobacteriovorax sp. HLS]|uniref:SPOR domain-containing protein n=1 Tax=Halobacteriovorax sp. HLS TaxID=2234000 RepID=UPI000FD90B7E|nr:SPOR domain-containing protein [Halobacteriovorax sp. HLS]
MDDKTKLYVFAKKEVFLIFVFMILISLTSFLLGVKIGVNNSFEQSGYTVEDKVKVDILSPDEEKVNELEEATKKNDEETYKALKEKTDNSLKMKMEKEFLNENSKFNSSDTPAAQDVVKNNEIAVVEKNEKQIEVPAPKSDDFTGKHTIQVGAFPSLDEAESFAKGFKARGYTPIINEAVIPNRGTWYRVSLGVFDNVSDAKDYVLEHKSLFESSEYHFKQFE